MPRRSKGARLWERKRKGRDPVWVIKDEGGIEISTSTSSRSEAEIQLSTYIANKFRPSGPAAADEITIGHILAIYAEEHAPSVADPARIGYAIDALDPFWGDKPASFIKGATCRRYTTQRGAAIATVRRELATLRAALNYCAKEGYLIGAPIVSMPDKPETEERWLSRQQVAILLWACRGLRIDGRQQMKRFIIASIYTGTRKKAALALGIDLPRTDAGWIDTHRGIIYRKGTRERATAKRRMPARCPTRLLSHARRWKAAGANFACEDYKGNRVADVRKGWENLIALAEDVAKRRGIEMPPRKLLTPHILKHTAITWAMQSGSTIEDAASFFSTSTDTIERVYWHHSPYCQESAVEAINNPVKDFNRGPKRGQKHR